MRKAKEVKCFRLPYSSLPALFGRKASKPDQTGFLRMQSQAKYVQTLPKLLKKLPGLPFILKANDIIIRITDEDHIPAR